MQSYSCWFETIRNLDQNYKHNHIRVDWGEIMQENVCVCKVGQTEKEHRSDVREPGVSWFHGCSITTIPESLGPSQHYRTEGFKGGLNWSLFMPSGCTFLQIWSIGIEVFIASNCPVCFVMDLSWWWIFPVANITSTITALLFLRQFHAKWPNG